MYGTRSCLVAVLLTGSCATIPQAKRQTVFYPPLPNPPRLQYLTSFSSAADIGEPRSGFAQFIAGEDPNKKLILQKPYGTAVHGGKIYVVDGRGAGYAIFDLVRKEFDFVTGSGPGKMKQPVNIAIDADGIKYVTDIGLGQVLAFDRENRFLLAYGILEQFKPAAVAIAGDRLYVSDLKRHEIQVLEKRSGALLFKFGQAGTKDGEFYYPTNMVIGPDGNLYVTDTMNFRIQKFTLDGQFIRSFGSIGVGLGQFSRPKGVALDREGRIYVVDAAFENVQIFDAEGRLLLFFGGPGGGSENINLPTTVVIDYENASLFQQYADPRFKVEYVVLVASQFGSSKLNVFGFGKIDGMDYDTTGLPTTARQ